MIDVVIRDCSNQHLLCSRLDYLGKESGRRGRLMWGGGGRGARGEGGRGREEVQDV